jgi:hypothetical protein
MNPKKLIFVSLLCLPLVLNGCIFDPREPENPSTEKVRWIPPNNAYDVLENMKNGLKATSNSNYEKSLASDFVFKPHPQAVSDIGDVFEGWNKEAEKGFLTRLKTEFTGERKIRFGDENGEWDREDISVGEAELEGEYKITLSAGDATEEEIYAGKAVFIFVESDVGWVIKKWEDIDIISPYATSGHMRGTYK